MTPNVRDLLKIPGRLSFGPTDLSIAYPHGGTALGLTKRASLRLGVSYSPDAVITAEEYAGEVVEAVQQKEGAVFTAALHSWDPDALAKIFPNTAAGASTGKRVVSAPGTTRAGLLLSARSTKLVFTPLDEDRHPTLILYRAMPSAADSAELSFRLGEEFGIGLVFVGIRDTSGRLYAFGPKYDLTL